VHRDRCPHGPPIARLVVSGSRISSPPEGLMGSNPAPSSGESVANLTSHPQRTDPRFPAAAHHPGHGDAGVTTRGPVLGEAGIGRRTVAFGEETGSPRSRPSSWWRFEAQAEAPRVRWAWVESRECGRCTSRERDRRHCRLCYDRSAAIKPCAFGAPLRGCGA
jgi:hypothetical protein